VFEKRALARDSEKFSNVIPSNSQVNINDVTETLDQPSVDLSAKDRFKQKADLRNVKQEDKFGFLDTLKDVGQQVISKGVSGAVGAYGNILDAFGLQIKKGEEIPANRLRNNLQFGVLDKLERGEIPSLGEFLLLADEDATPNYNRLPTSQEVQQGIEGVSGIGEGKTPSGRIAGRGAEFLAEGAMTGGSGKALASLAASGAAGQAIREAGGPESLATGTEIAGSISPTIVQGKLIPTGKGAKDIVEAGRKIGLTEKQLTPLVQSEGKAAILTKVARKGEKTKELFASIKEKLGDSYTSLKAQVANFGKVNAPNQKILLDKFTAIRDDLTKTLKASPDKEAAINFITDAIDNLKKSGTSPEDLINFWQDINKSVKWNSIQGGKKALTRLKEPISEVLENVVPNVAKDFEMTNMLYSKYSQIAKKLKPDLVDAFVNKGEILALAPAALSLINGNVMPIAALGGEVATRLLSREMLINPYFQNIANKLVKNFNQGSVKAVTETMKQVKEYMGRKHPNENWDFLLGNEDQSK